jgi:hypothetical protein
MLMAVGGGVVGIQGVIELFFLSILEDVGNFQYESRG